MAYKTANQSASAAIRAYENQTSAGEIGAARAESGIAVGVLPLSIVLIVAKGLFRNAIRVANPRMLSE